MNSSSLANQKKAKIILEDYPFERDIEIRIFLSQLNTTEIDVLREIIHHSLKISIEQLANELGLTTKQIIPILDKLATTKLFKRQHLLLIVDKDLRKYFESKMEKFENNFKPNFLFLQNILNKIPIHLLPQWYALPRTTDHIFEAIIEKYFLTPSIYRLYLSELQFENPLLKAIIQEVFRPPNFSITVEELLEKFKEISHEDLEKYLLQLEYHFVCCLSYKNEGDIWKEVVTPFTEWAEFLKFEHAHKPKSIPEEKIKKEYADEFYFVKQLSEALHHFSNKKQEAGKIDKVIQNKLVQLQFVEEKAAGKIAATKKGLEWLSKPLYEQITTLSHHPLNILNGLDHSHLWNARNLNLIEKSLRRIAPNQWVSLESFITGMIFPIGDQEPVCLQQKGKNWRYVLPVYNDLEKNFIEKVIMERFAQLGIIQTGMYQNQPCFCLTHYGHQAIH